MGLLKINWHVNLNNLYLLKYLITSRAKVVQLLCATVLVLKTITQSYASLLWLFYMFTVGLTAQWHFMGQEEEEKSSERHIY